MIPLKWQEGRQPRRLLCFSAAFFMVSLLFSFLITVNYDLREAILLTGALTAGFGAVIVLILRDQYSLFSSLLFGLLAGVIWCSTYGWFVWQPALAYDGMTGAVQLDLHDYAQEKERYGLAYGTVTAFNGQDCRINVKAYLLDGSPDYMPGDRLIFEGKFRAAERSISYHLLQDGIYLTLSQTEQETVVPCAAEGLLCKTRILSHRITETIRTLFPGNEGELLAALLSGEREGFSADFDRALTASGARHITAVSGLHITVLAGILMALFGKKLGLLVSVPVALIYSAIVGFSPSVIRATVLLAFWAASFWLKQEKDPLTAFSAALLLLLLWNPFSSLDAGLLLSFSATLGLILLSEPLNRLFVFPLKSIKRPVFKKLAHYAVSTVTATLAATLFTLPFNILFFDSIPLLGLFSNFLILWILPLTMILGVTTLLSHLLVPSIAAFFAEIVIWPLRWMVFVIELIGTSRFAAIDADNLLLLACCVILIAAAILWRERLLGEKTMLTVTVVLLCSAVIFTVGERRIFGVVEIENIGGQPAILLRNEGVSLINSGTRPQIAADMMRTAVNRWNVSELETVLCTTDNYKTQSGVPSILDVLPAERILLPSAEKELSAVWNDQPVSCYNDSGMITVSGCTTELYKIQEDQYVLRLLAGDLSLTSFCGLQPRAVRTFIDKISCESDLLLIDDTLSNDWELLYLICCSVKPDKILLVTNGYAEQRDQFCGIPVITLEHDRLSYRFTR